MAGTYVNGPSHGRDTLTVLSYAQGYISTQPPTAFYLAQPSAAPTMQTWKSPYGGYVS
jgi:hypothetical protein